jgi:titin
VSSRPQKEHFITNASTPRCRRRTPAGNIYASNWDTGQIVKITPVGQLSLLAGNGTYSDHHTIDRIGPEAPSAPRDVQATPTGGSLTVSFLPPTDAGTTPVTGYEVSTDGGTTWAPMTVTPAGERLTGTVAGSASSQVRVRAVNTSGASAPATGTVAASGGPAQFPSPVWRSRSPSPSGSCS